MERRMMVAVLLVLGCTSGESVTAQAPGMVPQEIAGHTLYLRSGFKVGIFADNLGGVRNIVLGPRGAVYAALQGRLDVGGRQLAIDARWCHGIRAGDAKQPQDPAFELGLRDSSHDRQFVAVFLGESEC